MRSPEQIGPVLALLGAVILIGALVRALRDRFRTGATPSRIHCPKCGETVEAAQAGPASGPVARGGYTCRTCGQAMDRWGRARVP